MLDPRRLLTFREVARQVRYAVRVGLVSAGDPADGVDRANAGTHNHRA